MGAMEVHDGKSTVNLVIVGHVDHGKSTLIGRLLFETDSLSSDRIEEVKGISRESGKEIEFAHLLDHLEEERSQGTTIDTTEVFFNTEKMNYTIIDAPGHVEFVRNMITGASHAEAAVLVVDAAVGVREQTKRHANILSLLGIDQTIVVLNKMDLVHFEEKRFEERKRAVGMFLASIKIDPVCYIPVCAVGGDNIAGKSQNMIWYGGPTLLDSLDALKERPSAADNPLIFPVQDVYELHGGRIAVGRVEAGTLRRGAAIKILPGGQTTEVLSVQRYPQTIDAAVAGQCAGITTADALSLRRGEVICTPGCEPSLSNEFEAKIIWLSEHRFDKRQPLVLRCATQETTCTLERIKRRIDSSTLELIGENADILQNTEVAEVIIKTDKPICIESCSRVRELGRFVLLEGDDTCAGGIITQGSRLR